MSDERSVSWSYDDTESEPLSVWDVLPVLLTEWLVVVVDVNEPWSVKLSVEPSLSAKLSVFLICR